MAEGYAKAAWEIFGIVVGGIFVAGLLWNGFRLLVIRMSEKWGDRW